MAKLQDKFFNRIIEGKLELDGAVEGDLELAEGGKAKIFENIVDEDGLNALMVFNANAQMPEGISVVTAFTKVVRNFNELQFIFSVRVQNTTESDIVISNDTQICNFGSLNEKLMAKIYGHNGYNLVETPNNITIAVAPLLVNQTNGLMQAGYSPRYMGLYYVKTSNRIHAYLENGNLTIPANTSYDLESRISLWL